MLLNERLGKYLRIKFQNIKYDIYKDTADKGKLWIGDKAGKVWRETKYYFEDLVNMWRKR